MLGFLKKHRSPLATSSQVDIDLLLRRNVDVIGVSVIQQAVVINDISAWQLDDLAGQQRLDAAAERVLALFPSSLTRCQLAIQPAEKLSNSSTYVRQDEAPEEPARIILAEETVADPLRTVMELANQYSTHFWHSVQDRRELDIHPRTTNLMPICCGMGVLASDACLYDQNWSQAGWTGWSISRSGYYNAAEIGYALALFCRSRHETAPAWLAKLRLDSKVAYQKAERFFAAQQRDGHRLLYDADKIPSTRCDPRELADWLAGDDPAFAYAAGLALIQIDALPASVANAALIAIRNADPEIPPLATRVLGRLRGLSSDVESQLASLMTRSSPAVQAAAFQSAGELGMSLSGYRSQLNRLLDHPAVDPLPIVELIGRQGHRLGFMAEKICLLLSYALRDGEDPWSEQLLACLRCLTDNPQALIEKTIRVPKLRERAIGLLSATQ